MKECFIICPLGDENSENRKKSDKMLKHVFLPVLDKTRYKAVRADQIPKVGLITTQIINLIMESELVIADLTDSNPNVFYELAIRHAVRKPYIQVITKGQKIPFDLSGIRTIEIDITDLDNVENVKNEILAQIQEFKKSNHVESPITVASSAQLLQNDSDLAEEIAEKLSYIGSYGYESGIDSSDIEYLKRKLMGLNDYSSVTFEDLDKKLELLTSKVEKISQKLNE